MQNLSIFDTVANIFDQLDTGQRASFAESVNGLIERCRKEIPMIRKSVIHAQRLYAENSNGYHYANMPLRLRLAMVDISSLFVKLLNETNNDEQNLMARMLCGQLYELLEDVPAMIGKKYRAIVKQYPVSEGIEAQLNQLVKNFLDIKNSSIERLKQIRHNVSAHKDEDGMKQAEIIETMDLNWVASDFIRIIRWFVDLYLPFELKQIGIAEKVALLMKG